MWCNDNVSTKENKDVRLNIRVGETLRDEFHVAARLRGATAAGLLHQFMVQTIWEEKKKHPEAFQLIDGRELTEKDSEVTFSLSTKKQQE